MNPVVLQWRITLQSLYDFYKRRRPEIRYFYPLLFLFFIGLNTFCYWWGIFTAFPEAAFGGEKFFYFKVQFPVGILGALFDSLSFFVTVFIIERSLKSTRSWTFVGHLSIDLVIAVLATFWVLFVFSFSGWLISFTEPVQEVLSERNAVYQRRVINAVKAPTDNLRNIYFGLIMGVSAMIPTCVHLFMAGRSVWSALIPQPVQSVGEGFGGK